MSPAARRLARVAVDRVSAPVGSVVRVRTDRPVVAMTFDDGPDPVGTPAALEVLRRHDATATFFVLMTRVDRHPDLLREIVAAGHEVGLHGIDHRRLTSLGAAELGRRMPEGRKRLEDAAGVAVPWFRPPYGAQDLRVWRAVRRAGMEPVFWGPSMWDWKQTTASARARKLQEGLTAGAIVLGHDGIAGPEDAAEEGPSLLPPDRSAWWEAALALIAARGLSPRALGEVAARGRLVRAARFGG